MAFVAVVGHSRWRSPMICQTFLNSWRQKLAFNVRTSGDLNPLEEGEKIGSVPFPGGSTVKLELGERMEGKKRYYKKDMPYSQSQPYNSACELCKPLKKCTNWNYFEATQYNWEYRHFSPSLCMTLPKGSRSRYLDHFKTKVPKIIFHCKALLPTDLSFICEAFKMNGFPVSNSNSKWFAPELQKNKGH